MRTAGTETYWVSKADGMPGSDSARCAPAPAGGWTTLNTEAASKLSTYTSAAALMRPSLVRYAPGCGVSIHMTEQSSGDGADPVSSVSRVAALEEIGSA